MAITTLPLADRMALYQWATTTNVIDQREGAGWVAYHADCVEAVRGMPPSSVDYSIFSPPFASLYTYSNSPRDMGNVKSDEEFFEHFGFIVAQLKRAGINVKLHEFQNFGVMDASFKTVTQAFELVPLSPPGAAA